VNAESRHTAYFENLLGVEAANAMVARFTATEGIGYITFRTAQGYFVNREFDRNDVTWQDYENAQVVDIFQKIEHEIQKFVLEIPIGAARAIAADFPDAALIQYSGGDWVQFACKNATKWNGVAAAAKHLGIDTAQIAAFGDDFNDIEMLEKCGIGVAMSNAIPEALAVADFIAASNNEDGVARWLEENLLWL
jgi:hydroxymethylpyrimidine pyrophosphatase-like HAD family hydrolase